MGSSRSAPQQVAFINVGARDWWKCESHILGCFGHQGCRARVEAARRGDIVKSEYWGGLGLFLRELAGCRDSAGHNPGSLLWDRHLQPSWAMRACYMSEDLCSVLALPRPHSRSHYPITSSGCSSAAVLPGHAGLLIWLLFLLPGA